MGHYLTRQDVCDRLRMSRWQSYQFVGPSYGPLVNSDSVLALLNHYRRQIAEPLQFVPDDLCTPEELAAELGEPNITARAIFNWTRRKKAVPPHFRLSKRTVLLSKRMFVAWLDERSQVKTLKVRVA